MSRPQVKVRISLTDETLGEEPKRVLLLERSLHVVGGAGVVVVVVVGGVVAGVEGAPGLGVGVGVGVRSLGHCGAGVLGVLVK